MRTVPTQMEARLVPSPGRRPRRGRADPGDRDVIRSAECAPVEALLADGARDSSLAPSGDPATAAAALFGAVTICGLSR